MFEILIQALVGLTAGFLGGLLGAGGAILIIPGLIFYLSHTSQGYSGAEQHLIQATAMLCNVFIAAPAVLAHRRARAIMKPVITKLIPSVLLGVIIGVTFSNSSYFAHNNGRYLAYILVCFLVYVAIYNIWRLFSMDNQEDKCSNNNHPPLWKILAVGLPTGICSGLLGIGGGSLCVPAQQIILKLPLRNSIANSAFTIVFTSFFGAIYKNATLGQHGFQISESIRLALLLIPTAIAGSYFGGRLTHKLPLRTLRIVFVLFILAVAAITFDRAYSAGVKAKTPDDIIISHD